MRWGGCRPPGRRQDVPAYFWFKLRTERTATMSIDTMIGVDLAKSVFQVHGASMNGEIQFQRKLSRQTFRTFMARHPAAAAAMEACGSAHYWARVLSGFRSEEHTSELQTLMRLPYAVLCS